VVCIDGSEPEYFELGIAGNTTPAVARFRNEGVYRVARSVVPSFTNPNNLSIVTGASPAVHGISGNYFYDPATGQEVMMNDPKFLRCETLLATLSRAGARVAVVTAKDKLRRLLGHVDPDNCSLFEDGLRVCATDIGDYLKANVLTPFGMSTSGYVWNSDYEVRAAQGHDSDGRLRNPRRRTSAVDAARYAAAGGLHTTATEYAKFMMEVIDPKPPDAYRLGREMTDEMIRPHVTVDSTSSWALGWQVIRGPFGDVISHGGDNPGFKAFVVASVAHKSGWVILMNGDNAGPIIQALVDEKCPLNEIFAS
jgi:hypothetical protein